jgi:hypothetical protein
MTPLADKINAYAMTGHPVLKPTAIRRLLSTVSIASAPPASPRADEGWIDGAGVIHPFGK